MSTRTSQLCLIHSSDANYSKNFLEMYSCHGDQIQKPKRPGYYLGNLETDKMCLVKITHKKSLPVPSHYLLPFYYFVRQFYGKGTNRIIPTVEKWVPGCGLNMIVPQLNHGDEFFDDIDLFTKFCKLTPNQVVSVFKEMAHNPGYLGSPFTAMTESELLKFETIETVLSEATQSEQNIAEEIEEKA
ncbi:hypothetical protein NQ317_006630 [Molorchus minor]|uniref:Uncharacterized protein n=1 Tax=Molorchus minor TaxID=1323400 RepID=A0ABQ9J0J0_9CUCU|nr:hypothetical protein NQ317_006630 [Molorchus minor]